MVRVVNRSAESAEVEIEAFDATERAYERLRLSLDGDSSEQFDSTDLEQGNAEKGLEGSTGSGEGNWWLELASESEIEVLSYVDMATGPLSAMRCASAVETETGMRYEAVLLSGAASELRLLNASGEAVEMRVSGTDDAGAPGGAVELTLAPWVSRTLTRETLEEGDAGLSGALGAGTGSWRLRLETDGEIDVLSLVRGSGGKLSDVSRRGRPAGAPPRTEVIDATRPRALRSEADLWVAASASEAELSPGEAFDLTATVGNVGDRRAAATTLRYYRSADATITTTDMQEGTDPVAALAAAQSIAGSLSLLAPTAPGTYRYGACADAVAEETNTANNCSAAVAVAVREPPRQPDLEVTASASAAALEPGESFRLRATVRNRGAAGARATTLRYYRSADAAIATTDAQVGTDAVDALAASGSRAESIALTAPSRAGRYYYGACVDAVEGEADTTDNCSSPVGVDVSEPTAPDLEVGTPTVDDASPVPGGSFTLSATVTNAGDGAAAATTLRYHRSADATITTTDTQVGTDAVEALATSGSSAESIALTAPTTSGTYYYGACVDAVEGESDTTDNCSAAVAVTVAVAERPAEPDLEARASLSASAVAPGGAFELLAAVRNRGGAGARATTLRYYRSTDVTITAGDTEVGTDPVDALAASGTSAESIALTAPSTSGTYYYGACVDAVQGESDATNNCSSPVKLDVVAREPTLRPDLAVTASGPDEPRLPGERFEVRATVRNVGAADAPGTEVLLYRSEDATVSPSDRNLGYYGFGATAVGDTTTFRWPRVRVPAQVGTYYYGACVTAVPNESNTSNNCSTVEVTVREPAGVPDLMVTADGMRCKYTATVSNVGTERALQSQLIGYEYGEGLKTDWYVPPLNPGQSFTIWSYKVAVGRYYGCVTAVSGETVTDNNCSAVFEVTK